MPVFEILLLFLLLLSPAASGSGVKSAESRRAPLLPERLYREAGFL